MTRGELPRHNIYGEAMIVKSDTDYARLIGDVMIWERAPQLDAKIAPLIPSLVDVGRECISHARRLMPGIEFGRCAAGVRNLYLMSDPDRAYRRQRCYTLISWPQFDIEERGDADAVRSGLFQAARLCAKQMVADAKTAQADRDQPMVIRSAGPVFSVLRSQFDNSAGAMYDPNSDSVMIRAGSYYFVTPNGEPWQPSEAAK